MIVKDPRERGRKRRKMYKKWINEEGIEGEYAHFMQKGKNLPRVIQNIVNNSA